MINEAYLELLRYRRIISFASLFIGAFWVVALLSAHLFKVPALVSFVIGGLLGSALAVINIFALGYAGFALYIKKSSGSLIFGPFASFTALLAGAIYTAFFFPGATLGFSFGLCSPLVLGAAVAFLEGKRT